MSVYVDPLCNFGSRGLTARDGRWSPDAPSPGGASCHLWADSVEELHAFAGRLGLHRSWFQADTYLPHYDLTERRRLLAVMLGAVECDRRASVNMWRALRAARDGGCRR